MSSVASLRQVRRRIRSVENTKKITRAMEMVAAVKLRRFQDFLESARPYTEKLENLLKQLLGELPEGYDHPFLEKIGDDFISLRPTKTALVLFTSDTGLCGTYNSTLEETAKEWLRENREKKVSLVFVGKHGASFFHRNRSEVLGTFSDLRVSRVDEILEGLKQTLQTAFLEGKAEEIHLAYTHMESLARYHSRVEKILPLHGDGSPGDGSVGDRSVPTPGTARTVPPGTVPNLLPNLIEPDLKTVLDRLLPAFFEARLRFIFYHALLTEQIARMSAMRQATQNAKEMIDELTLLRNKARQAAITKEIIEVVSGSQALKLR